MAAFVRCSSQHRAGAIHGGLVNRRLLSLTAGLFPGKASMLNPWSPLQSGRAVGAAALIVEGWGSMLDVHENLCVGKTCGLTAWRRLLELMLLFPSPQSG